MIASVGSLITGSGTSSTRTSRLPCQASAFITITPSTSDNARASLSPFPETSRLRGERGEKGLQAAYGGVEGVAGVRGAGEHVRALERGGDRCGDVVGVHVRGELARRPALGDQLGETSPQPA